MGACIQGRMVRFALETIRGRVSFFVNIKIWAPFYNPIVPDIDPHNSLSRWSQGLNMRDNKECSHTPPRDLCAYNFIIFACTLAKKCIVMVKKTFADAVKNTRHIKMLYNNRVFMSLATHWFSLFSWSFIIINIQPTPHVPRLGTCLLSKWAVQTCDVIQSPTWELRPEFFSERSLWPAVGSV